MLAWALATFAKSEERQSCETATPTSAVVGARVSVFRGNDDEVAFVSYLPRGSETLSGNDAASRRKIAREGVGGTLPRCLRRPVGARSSMAQGKEFLQELREFLAFLASLWGLLAAVSVFFPLSNLLTKVVPLGDQDKPFHNVSPGLVALLTTLSCIFLTFARSVADLSLQTTCDGGGMRRRRDGHLSRRLSCSLSMSWLHTACMRV